jgi:hypothetical protein
MLRIEIEKTIWASHRVSCVFCDAEFKHSFYLAVLYDSEWETQGHSGRVGAVCPKCQDAGATKTSAIVRERAAWLCELANEIETQATITWPSYEELRRLREQVNNEVRREMENRIKPLADNGEPW